MPSARSAGVRGEEFDKTKNRVDKRIFLCVLHKYIVGQGIYKENVSLLPPPRGGTTYRAA